jgi:hypothetical protein
MLSTQFWLYCTISENNRAKALSDTSALGAPAGLMSDRSRMPSCLVLGEEVTLLDAMTEAEAGAVNE